jgi:hypothetical protein
MLNKVSDNFNLSYVFGRAASTVVKLGACAVAPQSSSRIFDNYETRDYKEAIEEFLGIIDHPRISCAVGVVAKDAVDVATWVGEIGVVEDAVNFASSVIKKLRKSSLDGTDDVAVDNASYPLVNEASEISIIQE